MIIKKQSNKQTKSPSLVYKTPRIVTSHRQVKSQTEESDFRISEQPMSCYFLLLFFKEDIIILVKQSEVLKEIAW